MLQYQGFFPPSGSKSAYPWYQNVQTSMHKQINGVLKMQDQNRDTLVHVNASLSI